MPVPSRFPKTVNPGLTIIAGSQKQKKRRVKWLIGAAANLIVTDVGWVEEAGKSPLNTPTFTSRCFIRRYVPASSQRLPAATLSVARRRVVGWVAGSAAEFTSSCLSERMRRRRTGRGLAQSCGS
jgi:hypothetical protein